MLKPYLLIIAVLLTAFLDIYPQDSDPHAVYPPHQYTAGTEQNFIDNPLYVNINLSGNSAPQNEPSVRISRIDRNIIVAAWRDFRLGYPPNTVVRRIGYSYSTNGGTTWAVSQLLPDPGPTYVSQSDPVVTSDAQGNFYISSTSRQSNNFPELRNQIIYKSTNNGQTFAFTGIAIANTGGSGEDKEWLFCDLIPSNPTYNNLFCTSTNLNNGIIRFAKSTNGGLNWSTPVNVSDVSSGTGSNVCAGAQGQIYVVWGGIRFDKSTNGGLSFGTDYQLRSATLNGFPFICVDYSNRPTRGNIYVCWSEATDVFIQRSTNAGVNWLANPIRVNDITTNNQFWPAIQCDTNGYLSVVYFDNRTGSNYNSYYAYSTDAGNTWVNQLLSDSSFAMIAIGGTGGAVRYGDYIGIDAFSNKIFPVWTDDRAGTPNQEIYTGVVTIVLSSENHNTNIPSEFSLSQNYPNPFNPSTSIEYSLPENSWVTLKIYDILGNEVAVIYDGLRTLGIHSVTFDASNLSSGIYYYTLKAGDFSDTKKMILIK